MMGSACLGGGAGRAALRAVTMTAQILLTILLDFNSLLPQLASLKVAMQVYQAIDAYASVEVKLFSASLLGMEQSGSHISE